MKKFNYFVGIDQTGAVDRKGKPKKLPTCIYHKKDQKFVFCSLEKLTWADLSAKLPDSAQKSEVFVLIDSVFGLPQDSNRSALTIRDLIQRTENYEFEKKAFGLKTAHHFFNQFNPQKDFYPKRKVEVLVGANSLFLLHPFQKNISCGTYRIWKNLSEDLSWFHVWPFEKPNRNTAYLAEGYPSYYWRKIFKLKSRNIDQLLSALPQKVQRQIRSQKAYQSPDSMDAFILAYSAEKILRAQQPALKALSSIEGWILGV